MLGKLLKYDFKALSRVLLPLHGLAILMTFIGWLFITTTINADNNLSHFAGIYVGLLIFLLFAAITATAVIIAVHFYRSLFSRQGYLTWTLPAAAGQLLLSKTISALTWTLIDILITMGSVFLLCSPLTTYINWDGLESRLTQGLGITPQTLLLYTTVLITVSCLGSILYMYVSIAFGQLFLNHRILVAFISYAVIYIVIQIIGGIFLLFSSGDFLVMKQEVDSISGEFVAKEFGHFYTDFSIGTIIFVGIQFIIFYLITYHIMAKKVNLH